MNPSQPTQSVLHFALPEDEALALIELGVALEPHTRKASLLDKATLRMDEQRADQSRSWERCDKCDGSGWVEES